MKIEETNPAMPSEKQRFPLQKRPAAQFLKQEPSQDVIRIRAGQIGGQIPPRLRCASSLTASRGIDKAPASQSRCGLVVT
jgi:hypothetical protein